MERTLLIQVADTTHTHTHTPNQLPIPSKKKKETLLQELRQVHTRNPCTSGQLPILQLEFYSRLTLTAGYAWGLLLPFIPVYDFPSVVVLAERKAWLRTDATQGDLKY